MWRTKITENDFYCLPFTSREKRSLKLQCFKKMLLKVSKLFCRYEYQAMWVDNKPVWNKSAHWFFYQAVGDQTDLGITKNPILSKHDLPTFWISTGEALYFSKLSIKQLKLLLGFSTLVEIRSKKHNNYKRLIRKWKRFL